MRLVLDHVIAFARSSNYFGWTIDASVDDAASLVMLLGDGNNEPLVTATPAIDSRSPARGTVVLDLPPAVVPGTYTLQMDKHLGGKTTTLATAEIAVRPRMGA